MKKIVVYLMIICSLFFSIKITTDACWAFLTIEELEEQSDLIVIGRYKGDVREIIDGNGIGYRFWTIEVEYVLKGAELPVIEVITGGSSKSKISFSTDYKLTDIAEDYMLLYLIEDQEGQYAPCTPRGIVKLETEQSGPIFDAYKVDSSQHIGEYDEIANSLESMESIKIEKTPVYEAVKPVEIEVINRQDQLVEQSSINKMGIGLIIGMVILSISVKLGIRK